MKILVLCTGNSCRSIMTEACLRAEPGSGFEVFSAGTEAHGVHPFTIAVLTEAGISTEGLASKKADTFSETFFDVVLTVCDRAAEACPYFPGSAKRIHHSFPDPAQAKGSESERMEAFRAVLAEIRAYCRRFADEAGTLLSS